MSDAPRPTGEFYRPSGRPTNGNSPYRSFLMNPTFLLMLAGWLFTAGGAWVQFSNLQKSYEKVELKLENFQSTTNQMALDLNSLKISYESIRARVEQIEQRDFQSRYDAARRRMRDSDNN